MMRLMRYVARFVGVVWAGWWTLFGVMCGIGEGMGSIGTLMHAAVPGLVFAASLVVAWKWELVGGIILAAEGGIVAVGYPVMVRGRFPASTVITMLLTMAAPPLAAGILFVICGRRSKAEGA